MNSSANYIDMLFVKFGRTFARACGVICFLNILPAHALGPTYEEDMARQRAQEQQIMEENNTQEELAVARQQEDDSGPSADEFSSAYYDPLQTRLKAAIDVTELAAAPVGRNDKISADPKFQQYQQGSWDFFQAKKAAAPGEFCTGFFWKKDGFVSLLGPGGGYNGAVMTFWSKDIPRPANQEKVQVTLKQTGDKPQTVQALNFITPGTDYGAISLAVPSIAALLAGIEDVQSFELAMQGKTVAKVAWHSGLFARKKIQDCVSAQAKN